MFTSQYISHITNTPFCKALTARSPLLRAGMKSCCRLQDTACLVNVQNPNSHMQLVAAASIERWYFRNAKVTAGPATEIVRCRHHISATGAENWCSQHRGSIIPATYRQHTSNTPGVGILRNVKWTLSNSSTATRNILHQLQYSLPSLGTYAFHRPRLCSGSPLPEERMHTVAANHLPQQPLTIRHWRICYCLPFTDSFNFIVYNDFIELQYIYFHVCFPKPAAASLSYWHRFECGTETCSFKNSYLLVRMLVARWSI